MKNLIKNVSLMSVAAVFILSSCENEDPIPEGSYSDVMAEQVKMDLVDDASISPYAAIFDVSPMYDQGHLPFTTEAGSVDGLESMLGDLDKSLSYLVYCHGDGPSIAAAELMADQGFSSVHRLKGNYGAWDAVSFVDISPETAKAKMDAGNFEAILDVSPVYNDGHLPGATNANASGGGTDLSELIETLDKSRTYLVYCHGDAPAMAGAQLMEDAGFTKVFRLEGNYGAWVEAGYDVETSTNQSSYTDVMADQVKMNLVDDASISPYAAIFDVSPVFDQGHLPFAKDAGGVSGLGSMLDGLDKNLSYLVYCHGDAPAIQAAELMVMNGFTKVHRLKGNYGAYDALSFVDITATRVKSMIDAGEFEAIFDVSPYYANGHLPGAIDAAGGGSKLSELIASMDKSKNYLVYCHGNGPAFAGAQLMEDAGFSNVFRLEGNYGAWVDAGYAVE